MLELIVRFHTQQLNSSSDAELKLDGFQEEASPSRQKICERVIKGAVKKRLH